MVQGEMVTDSELEHEDGTPVTQSEIVKAVETHCNGIPESAAHVPSASADQPKPQGVFVEQERSQRQITGYRPEP